MDRWRRGGEGEGVGNGGTLIARVLERVFERRRRRSFIASSAARTRFGVSRAFVGFVDGPLYPLAHRLATKRPVYTMGGIHFA
jgi:hypothetical protein